MTDKEKMQLIQKGLNILGFTGSDGKALTVDGNWGSNTSYAWNNFWNTHVKQALPSDKVLQGKMFDDAMIAQLRTSAKSGACELAVQFGSTEPCAQPGEKIIVKDGKEQVVSASTALSLSSLKAGLTSTKGKLIAGLLVVALFVAGFFYYKSKNEKPAAGSKPRSKSKSKSTGKTAPKSNASSATNKPATTTKGKTPSEKPSSSANKSAGNKGKATTTAKNKKK